MKHTYTTREIREETWTVPADKPVVGLDLGSRGSKAVLLYQDRVHTAVVPTGLFMQETADDLLEKLLQGTGLAVSDLAFIVSTGYGRISLQFESTSFEVVTEISCHAMGAHAVHPATRTIIDIGGQDSKAIKVDPRSGKVAEFVMNDKCAAGTGRFLEKAAALLGIDLDQMGQAALESINPAVISSQCVVFAESEMISLRAKAARNNDREATANIAAGIHYSAARRVRNLLGRVGTDPDLVFTGGVSKNPGMRKILEELLEYKFTPTNFDMMFAGALGAAVYAAQYANQSRSLAVAGNVVATNDLVHIVALLDQKENQFVETQGGTKKVGYFCAYTPLEVLSAAGVLHARLYKAGDTETVAAGEALTQSVFCDFSKSCIGGFTAGEGAIPFYRSLDKVYNFHTCGSMKRVSEVLGTLVPTTLLNLPKFRHNPESRLYFRDEIIHFKKDLEELTGTTIPDATISARIVEYNKVRRLIKKISELRLRKNPPLSGTEFLELVRGFYFLEPETYLPVLEDLYESLSAQPDAREEGKLRIMLAGSIVADGDRRLLDLLEKELGHSVVIEDHCAGIKPFYETIREDADPAAALADGYLDQAPCARMKPLQDSLDFTARLATEYGVDGVIYTYQKFCGCYGVGKKEFLDRFQELGLPVLELSSDYSVNDQGQIKTRVEAFVEILHAQRSKQIEQLVNA